MAELQQLGEAEPAKPFKYSWCEYGLLIVANSSLGDDGPYQNARHYQQKSQSLWKVPT